MKFSGFNKYLTGVLTPVFSLKTRHSEGVGDFLDLLELGEWCSKSGLDCIQLLPVNDTGGDPSPYSALSAFALHPIYLRIAHLPECKKPTAALTKNLALLHGENEKPRVNYSDILRQKLHILNSVFDENKKIIFADPDLQNWIDKNLWIRDYSVFCSLKRKYTMRSWIEWPEYNKPTRSDLDSLWDDSGLRDSNIFYAWIQWRLEQQFIEVSKELKKAGIILKGDIPILMNEDSVDVWSNRDIFHLDLRAGAPPDMFSDLGQNWGFPVYNWERLERRNYDWWRNRLLQADKFYQAYRIDHVLGFFRIWTVPAVHRDGILGHFSPAANIHREDLYKLGFDDGRIRWLSEPHLRSQQITEAFGSSALEVFARVFDRLGDEDLYLFKPSISGERSIYELPFEDDVVQSLLHIYRDRTFIELENGELVTTWSFRNCSRYRDLFDHEKNSIEELVTRKNAESDALWEHHGEKLLSFMRDTVDMLTCAEDLGAIPGCVPRVLDRQNILSLKIPRWARKWGEAGEPYIPQSEYPLLSVCAPSVHDTSTLREWWENEDGSQQFWNSMGLQGQAPTQYDEHTAKTVIENILKNNSALTVFQLQDLFAFHGPYRVSDSKSERINIPGTVQDSNWSYRVPMLLEDLGENNEFCTDIFELVSQRSAQKLQRDI